MRFFVSRHVSKASPPYVHSLAGRCLESIRRVYPSAHVTIVEDKIDPDLSFGRAGVAEADAALSVVDNPFPGSGELGTLYVAMHSDQLESGELLIAMHDSMVLLSEVTDGPGYPGVRMLWDFWRFHFHHAAETLRLMASLIESAGSKERYSRVMRMAAVYGTPVYSGRAWSGCFGMGLLATREGLEALNSDFGILDSGIIRKVHTREHRQAMERITGMAIFLVSRGSPLPPVCGDIFSHPEPWDTESAKMTLQAIKCFVEAKGYRAPLAKSWVGR